ncbi:hypothetical protein [Micromonospora tarapacensis]|uniref:hypothetical protein n=1 Tax=Micromonospora tarapacensis TaxID=2835305 RepID=UPI002F400062
MSGPVSATPWRRLSADLAAAMRPHLPATVAAVAVAVTEATPAFAGIADDKFTRDAHTAVQVALDRFLDLIGTDEPALPPRFREVFVALGAAEAREDRGPEALLAALRTAARLLLRTASQSLARLRPVDTEELIDLSDAVSAYVAELAAASTDGYALQVREQAGEGTAAGSSPSCCCAATPCPARWRRRRPGSAGPTSTPWCPSCCRWTRPATRGSGTAPTAWSSSVGATRCCCCGPAPGRPASRWPGRWPGAGRWSARNWAGPRCRPRSGSPRWPPGWSDPTRARSSSTTS